MAKRKSALRYFVLRDSKGREGGIFTGRSPRQAALKIANLGHMEFSLRERGTKKVHLFKGWRAKIPAPNPKPAWMPDEVWKPNVKKLGIQKLTRIRKD